jgi:TonB family protein
MNRQMYFLAALFLLLANFLHASSDVERHLRNELKGKTFVLRDFYTGDHLHYDSSAAPLGGTSSGDWMSDGFVLVKDLRFSHHRVTIEAERQLVIELEGKEFQFLPEDKSDRRKLKIEADLNLDTLTPQQLDADMAKIFLSAQDNLAASVSDYWKPCVLTAALGGGGDFRFSPDLLTVPGVAAARGIATATPINEKRELDCSTAQRNERGVHPIPIYQAEPEFSERARREKRQGVVILSLVVNDEGIPSDITIIRPLGFGLDENAIRCVKNWRFKPAEKAGHPVAMKITVEVDFHLY